jgi:hypothetical protein
LCNDGCHEYIDVRIYPRVLDKSESKFEKDPQLKANNFFNYELDICNNKVGLDVPSESETVEMPQLPIDTLSKEFIYSFMSLSYFHRKQIIADFHLDSPSDDGHKHVELLDEYIKRAQAGNYFDALLTEVQRKREGIDKSE